MVSFEQLSKADTIISNIRKALNYQLYMTPVNFKSENERFIESYKNREKYNPQYIYVPIDTKNLNELWNELAHFEQNDSGVSQIISKNIISLRNEINMYENIGDNERITDASILVYGNPDAALLGQAKDELKKPITSDNPPAKHDAFDLEKVISARLKKYGFSWNVVVQKNMASRISVEPEYNTIFINQNGHFTDNDLIRLQVHEIDTHVLRTENGRRHNLNIFSGDSPVVLKDEEGLALYNEHIHQVQDEYSLKLYAARFLCCCNIDLSFYDMYDMLISHGCSSEQSLYVVSRIKRGLSDTSLPGGYNKDYVYFQGLHDMMSALSNNIKLYRNLYFGAISIDDVKLLNIEIEAYKNSMILPLDI